MLAIICSPPEGSQSYKSLLNEFKIQWIQYASEFSKSYFLPMAIYFWKYNQCIEKIIINSFEKFLMIICFVVPTLLGTAHAIVRKYPEECAIIWKNRYFISLNINILTMKSQIMEIKIDRTSRRNRWILIITEYFYTFLSEWTDPAGRKSERT